MLKKKKTEKPTRSTEQNIFKTFRKKKLENSKNCCNKFPSVGNPYNYTYFIEQ